MIFTQEHEELRRTVRSFVEREINPNVDQWEKDGRFPIHEIFRKAGELGLLGISKPEKFGGMGLDYSYSIVAAEEFGSITCGGIPMAIGVQTDMCTPALARFGSDELREEFLRPAIAGEMVGCIGVSEVGAGSDVAGLKTTARKDGDDYVINGTKTWISNSIEGNIVALLTKTDPEAEPRHKGMSLFLAEKGPGFSVSRKLEKLGYKGIDSGELIFEDYRVPADRLIGGEEGRGFHHAVGGLELGRINVAARAVGIANAALNDSVKYAQVRKTMGKPIAQHQAIQLKLAEMATRAEASRLLVEQAAGAYDRGERCDMEAGMAKLFASETGLFCATEAMRIHGAYGYSKEFDIERYYRDAPLMCIGEGTNEIQRIVIARQLVARNPV